MIGLFLLRIASYSLEGSIHSRRGLALLWDALRSAEVGALRHRKELRLRAILLGSSHRRFRSLRCLRSTIRVEDWTDQCLLNVPLLHFQPRYLCPRLQNHILDQSQVIQLAFGVTAAFEDEVYALVIKINSTIFSCIEKDHLRDRASIGLIESAQDGKELLPVVSHFFERPYLGRGHTHIVELGAILRFHRCCL